MKTNVYSSKFIATKCILVMVIIGLIVTLVVLSVVDGRRNSVCYEITTNQTEQFRYKRSAVASDAVPCESVANDIMSIQGGNAVDAAIAGIFCQGTVNIHSSGLAGGGFMMIYVKKENKAYAVDLREEAPQKAQRNMFVNVSNLARHGGLSIAVPGYAAGLYDVWKKLGSKRVPWKKLIEPSIKLAESGIQVTAALQLASWVKFRRRNSKLSRKYKNLRNFLTNKKTGKLYRKGDTLYQPKMAKTLRILANEPYAIRNGSLTAIVVKEIKQAGGIIIADDLARYKPKWRTPVVVELTDGTRLHTLPPPSSGSLIPFILNVLSKYQWKDNQLDNCEDAGLFFHRFVEALKFAYAERSGMGDMDYVDMTDMMANLTSSSFASYIQSRINDTRTYSPLYYNPKFDMKQNHGTAHMSLVSAEGDAVSVTSTINTYFGSRVLGTNTGLIYNNEMDDFSIPNTPNSYNLQPSPSNFIQPGKRPMSSMSPIILSNQCGQVKAVIGASGGSKIISGVAQVAALVQLLNMPIGKAISYPRLHHQLMPNVVMINNWQPKNMLIELKKRGHKIKNTVISSTVEGIKRIYGSNKSLTCAADHRKHGRCAGA